MINIRYFTNLKEIRNEWVQIFKNSSQSYFTSPQWHAVVLSLLQNTHLTKRLNRLHYFTASSDDSTVTEVVGFFYIKNRFGKKTLIFGHLMNYSDYYDFVYKKNLSASLAENMVAKIADDFKVDEIQFNHLSPHSKFLQPLRSHRKYQITGLECVAVHLSDNYENYLKTLSKSVRQNLRTARNRVEKNNLDFGYQILTQKDIDQIDFQRLKDLYLQRNTFKNEEASFWKTRVIQFLDNGFSMEKDMFDIPAIKETDFTLGVLYLNGELAAYFFGFRAAESIEINRVVINDEFKFYSPGLLLLNEYIKREIPAGLRLFDLTLGDEKYKYDLGGRTHLVYNLKKEIR